MQQLARKREEQLGVLDYNLRVAQEDLVELQVSCSLLVHKFMLRPDCCWCKLVVEFFCHIFATIGCDGKPLARWQQDGQY